MHPKAIRKVPEKRSGSTPGTSQDGSRNAVG